MASTIKSSIASFVSAGAITCGSTITVAGQTDGQYLFQCSATSVVSGVQSFIVPQLCCSPPPGAAPALTVTVNSGSGSSADSSTLQTALATLVQQAKAASPSASGLAATPTATPTSGTSSVVALLEAGQKQSDVSVHAFGT